MKHDSVLLLFEIDEPLAGIYGSPAWMESLTLAA